jgi:hypothetical protein
MTQDGHGDFSDLDDQALLDRCKEHLSQRNPDIPPPTRKFLDGRFAEMEDTLSEHGRLRDDQRADLERFCKHFEG